MRWFRRWWSDRLRRLADQAVVSDLDASRREIDELIREGDAERRNSKIATDLMKARISLLEADVEYLTTWRARELASLKAEIAAKVLAGKIPELSEREFQRV